MSETVIISPEKQPEKQVEVKTPAVEKHEYSDAEKAANVEKAKAAVAAVESDTKSAERPALPVDDKPSDNRPVFIDKAVKTLRLRQSLRVVQHRLKPADRALSKVIHQPAVRAVSEFSSRTVTRPSGLLGGGIVAFADSLLYLYLAKHIGFTYNYLAFLAFFVGGFLLGLAGEWLLHLARPKAAK